MARKKNLTESELLTAEALYLTGKTSAEVSKELQFNNDEVRAFLRERGVLRKRGGVVRWVDSEHIKCSRCEQVKHINDIVYNTNNHHHRTGAYLSYCKACKAARSRKNLKGRAMPWSARISRLKSRCDLSGVPLEITADDLEWLYQLQDGRCVYTQEVMLNVQGNGQHPLALSIDRIDSSGGYTKDNTVLCTYRANTIKHNMTPREMQEWMPLWWSRLQEFTIRRNNGRDQRSGNPDDQGSDSTEVGN